MRLNQDDSGTGSLIVRSKREDGHADLSKHQGKAVPLVHYNAGTNIYHQPLLPFYNAFSFREVQRIENIGNGMEMGNHISPQFKKNLI